MKKESICHSLGSAIILVILIYYKQAKTIQKQKQLLSIVQRIY